MPRLTPAIVVVALVFSLSNSCIDTTKLNRFACRSDSTCPGELVCCRDGLCAASCSPLNPPDGGAVVDLPDAGTGSDSGTDSDGGLECTPSSCAGGICVSGQCQVLPLNVSAETLDLPSISGEALTVPAGCIVTIDTTTPEVRDSKCGIDATSYSIRNMNQRGGGRPATLLLVKSLNVVGTMISSGSRPLLVVAQNTITVSGLVDVSSVSAVPASNSVVGAGVSPCLLGNGGMLAGNPDFASGGAGGSFASKGGNGGAAESVAGGAASAAASNQLLEPLRGGCSGGTGGGLLGGDSIGTGGEGGGAIQLSAFDNVTISGNILANGAGGREGEAAMMTGAKGTAGGGGGSGGAILLDSKLITLAGARIVAVGGGGGAGVRQAPSAPGSGGGENGSSSGVPAPGGLSSRPMTNGSGGTGSGQVDGVIQPAQSGGIGLFDGTNSPVTGGGGGGSIGIVRFNTKRCTQMASSTLIPRPMFSGTAMACE
jgi:hypothetical protein